MSCTRRQYLQGLAALTATVALPRWSRGQENALAEKKGANIAFGLVTYQWGKSWDLPTLIRNCAAAKLAAVELRTTHAHGVEPKLTDAERAEVKSRFFDSGVRCVGIGSDERFDNPDPAVVAKAIEATKAFVMLSHDIGGTGVKVKPDRFYPNVPREQTIEQIGKALNQLGEFADGFGQQIRLEVHGQCCELPTIEAIMKVADHPAVAVCWNSNPDDLKGDGLEGNFQRVAKRLGATAHIHRLDSKTYPHQQLLDLLVGIDYAGFLLLEEGTIPADPAAELIVQQELFTEMLADSRRRVG